MINSKGQCDSCGRDFLGENLEGKPCPATDECPSYFEEIGKEHPDHITKGAVEAKERKY
tara:strand:- start:12924 stop:13100 length:177 start_codon:yes stop_codon:yes gene_type:complete